MVALGDQPAVPVKTILFDWGGVLSSGGIPDEMPRRLNRATDIHPDQLRKITKSLTGLLKIGKISIDDFWSTIELETGSVVPLSKRDIWATMDELKPGRLLIEFTEDLKRRGYTVAILSNTFPNTAADIEARGWYEPYSPVFLSSTVGMAKPDKEFYRYAIRELKNDPSEIVFIDDQQKCLDPAAEMGILTVLAKTPQQVVDDIESILTK